MNLQLVYRYILSMSKNEQFFFFFAKKQKKKEKKIL